MWRYRAHINVEVCSTLHAVKYLHKYIHKGGDRAQVELADYAPGDLERLDDGSNEEARTVEDVDEIERYVEGRYISTSEAVWRAMKFDLHDNSPSVVRLHVHLPGENVVTFDEREDLCTVADTFQTTTLLMWFEYNKNNEDGRHLTYVDFPSDRVVSKSHLSFLKGSYYLLGCFSLLQLSCSFLTKKAKKRRNEISSLVLFQRGPCRTDNRTVGDVFRKASGCLIVHIVLQ